MSRNTCTSLVATIVDGEIPPQVEVRLANRADDQLRATFRPVSVLHAGASRPRGRAKDPLDGPNFRAVKFNPWHESLSISFSKCQLPSGSSWRRQSGKALLRIQTMFPSRKHSARNSTVGSKRSSATRTPVRLGNSSSALFAVNDPRSTCSPGNRARPSRRSCVVPRHRAGARRAIHIRGRSSHHLSVRQPARISGSASFTSTCTFATLPVCSFLRRRRIANRGAWRASLGAQSARCSAAAIVAGRPTPRPLVGS